MNRYLEEIIIFD
jgi:hypothetical protein